MLRRAAEVSFLDDCPTTTLFPVGPVKVVPVGPAEAVAAVAVEAAVVAADAAEEPEPCFGDPQVQAFGPV
jgi:hypothetical protein